MARKDRNLPRGMLTGEEIAKTAESAGSGFTTRTTGGGVGRRARNVLSTGFAPEGGRAEEVNVDPTASAAEQIAEFNRQRLPILGAPGASMGVGGWQDPETNIVGMDASVLLPKTVGGMVAATHIAGVGRQAAIGNLGPGSAHERMVMGTEDKTHGYLGDIEVPEHLHGSQFEPTVLRGFSVSGSGEARQNKFYIDQSPYEEREAWARTKAEELGYPDDTALSGMGAEEYLNKYGSSDS